VKAIVQFQKSGIEKEYFSSEAKSTPSPLFFLGFKITRVHRLRRNNFTMPTVPKEWNPECVAPDSMKESCLEKG